MANFSYAKFGKNVASPYTREDLPVILDKIKHQRGSYLTVLADSSSPFISGEWRVNFDDVFADTGYSAWVQIDDSTFSYTSPALQAFPINVVRSPAYVSGRLWFPFAGTSPAIGAVPLNHPFTIDVLAIQD